MFYNGVPSSSFVLNGTSKSVESSSHSDTWTSAEPLSSPFKG